MTKNIIIMSYNIKWDSMNDKITSKNIINNIINTIATYEPNIIGLQEAYKWTKIIKHIDLNKYGFIKNKSGKEEMITLWNVKRFKNLNAFASEFEDGRPFLILLLYDKITNKNICVINIHASHNLNTQKNIFDIINKKIKKINLDFSRVIMFGDFNRNVITDDKSNYKIYNKDKYFSLKGFDSNIKTCCSNVGYGHKFIYDHVIDSISPLNKIVVNDKWYEKKSSDHLMIIGKLK
jgi:endonuclease/exonuclease/phosphatase family metal-dependent hydrolase